ncbi:hypothetical protein SPI_09371 [Niveomyces insectorum RCEF 264]|uniref:PH domain-containing protein n=1 Tax=Niveomyces insectorum RCEF 264 TaxID=1081102 RepID=A0A167LSD9_9HYPO|nr:hypothetical protein SPI_09371 [Niveomyces insectorum RCEF 264]
MADPLSITASVAGVAALGYSIAKGLYQIADDMSVAGLEVRVYANEIDSFAKLLLNVQSTVDGLTCSAAEIAKIKTHIKEILDNCDRILKPLHEVQEGLLPLLQRFRDSPSKMLQVALRIRWTFISKGKVLFYRELLQRQHQMLDTHLARATLVSVQSAMRTNPQLMETSKLLHASLENSVSALTFTISGPTAAQAQGQAQLLLGYASEAGPGQWQAGGGGSGTHSSADGLPVRPRSSQGVASPATTSTALVVVSSSHFGPDPGPALTHLTEQEAQNVLNATNLDIDDQTMTNMEKILDDTEDAEHKAVRMAADTLSNASSVSSSGSGAGLFAAAPGPEKRLSSSAALARCGSEVMGRWSVATKRVYKASRMRFELFFETPVFFVCPASNKRGPLPNAAIWIVDGTDRSVEQTRSLPSGGSILVQANRPSRVLLMSPQDVEMSTWLRLLQECQLMERDSRVWADEQYRRNEPGPVCNFGTHTLCVALQAKRRSWDAVPASISRPYATTTISHIVEIAAMLGIYWKEFDRSAGKYRAEGNGYILEGSHVSDLGILFTFQVCGRRQFAEDRIIPVDECKELAFGLVPTIFRDMQDLQRPAFATDNTHNLSVLSLGSRNELADTLVSFGCNTHTSNCLRDETKRHGHLFPLAFEITGMLGRTLHIKDSFFRSLPNPTFYRWNKRYFSMRKMLEGYDSQIRALPQHIEQIISLHQLSENINGLLRNKTQRDHQDKLGHAKGGTIYRPLLEGLHDALDVCDVYLKRVNRLVVELVLREHIQELLRMVNNEGPYGSTTQDDGTAGAREAEPISQVGQAGDTGKTGSHLRFDDLMTASPEERQDKLMQIYFRSLLPRVAEQASVAVRQADESENDDENDAGTRAEATTVWCTLVFRMLCWLLLHDFHEMDVQVPKSELLGSRQVVYIV